MWNNRQIFVNTVILKGKTMYKASSVSNLSMFGIKGVIKEGTSLSEICQL